MNSSDINSIIDNLCNKLGTTANKLIPEMAGYQIAKHSIWLVVSLIFIGVCIGLTIKILRMHKADGEMLALYSERFKKIDERLQRINYEIEGAPQWVIQDWKNTLCELPRVTTVYNVDESTYCAMVITAVWSGLIGIVIFGVALYHIIGWCIAPNASAFMWVINQLGGGQ